MTNWQKQERRTEIQKFEYLEKVKSSLDEIKSIFIVYEMLTFDEK